MLDGGLFGVVEGSVKVLFSPRQEGTTSATKKSRLARPYQRQSEKSIHTLRYEVLSRAGIVQYLQDRPTLTLSPNLPTRGLFQRMVARLA